MKKWSYLLYLLSGILIGALVATSGSAVAAQVKSLVGQKVTGEYKVVVNGEVLQDKGAVIDGRTNAPVRAISESLGADLKVDNKSKTITITTEETSNTPAVEKVEVERERQRSELLAKKKEWESIIDRLEKNKAYEEDQYNKAEEGFGKEIMKQALDNTIKQLAERTQELNKINAELEALNK